MLLGHWCYWLLALVDFDLSLSCQPTLVNTERLQGAMVAVKVVARAMKEILLCPRILIWEAQSKCIDEFSA